MEMYYIPFQMWPFLTVLVHFNVEIKIHREYFQSSDICPTQHKRKLDCYWNNEENICFELLLTYEMRRKEWNATGN